MPRIVIDIDDPPSTRDIAWLRRKWPKGRIEVLGVEIPAEVDSTSELVMRIKGGGWGWENMLKSLSGNPRRLIVLITVGTTVIVRRNYDRTATAIRYDREVRFTVVQWQSWDEFAGFISTMPKGSGSVRTAWGRIAEAIQQQQGEEMTIEEVVAHFELPDEVVAQLHRVDW